MRAGVVEKPQVERLDKPNRGPALIAFMLRLIFLIGLISCTGRATDPAPSQSSKKPTVTIGPQTWLLSDKDSVYLKWDDLANFCPSGFRIADRADFAILASLYPNDPEGLINVFKPKASGFYDSNGAFISLPDHYFYWTDSEFNDTNAYNFMVSKSDGMIESYVSKDQRLCVRCIRK